MKYWKALVAATMAIALSACGGGDGSDKNEPPPPPNPRGSLSISASKPVLSDTGQLTVEFKVTDKQGNGYDLGKIKPSFTLSKVATRVDSHASTGSSKSGEEHTFWKSFFYSYGSAGSDSDGQMEPLGNGRYRYTFSFNPTAVQDPYFVDSRSNKGLINWDKTATHRLGIFFGGENNVPLTDFVLDWVPAGTAPTLARDIVDQTSCNSCHMKKPFRAHTDRANPKLCVTCHNESDPQSYRRSLATIVHQYHGPQNKIDGRQVFPQDTRNCDTCHKAATPTTPNADNWQHAQAKPCGACHVNTDPKVDADFDAHITGKIKSGAVCTQCHGADSNKSPATVHMGYMANEAIGRDKLVFKFDDVRYAAPTIEAELNITIDGKPADNLDEVMQYIDTSGKGKPAILLNWDQGNGFELAASSVDLKACESQGAGKFLCRKEVGNEVNGTLAATLVDLKVCVARKGDRNGAFAAGDLRPCGTAKALSAVAINSVKAYFRTEGGVDGSFQLKSGADLASCNSCHKDLAVHIGKHAVKDMNQCTSCHNANRPSYYAGVPGDLKYHVHSFHKFGSKHGGTPDKPASSHFPGKANNCESCHTKAQYNLPNQQNARPSLAATTTDNKLPKYFSPTLVVCSSCHLKSPLGLVKPDSPVAGDEWATHMKNNGAVFGAETSEAATGVEQCASCHAVGMDQGVDKVHKVYDFR